MKPLPDAVKRFLTDAPVCRIASARADGTPHAIPVCPVFDGKSSIYIDITGEGVTARGFRENARITALFDEYFDDWRKLKAVVLKCDAIVVPEDDVDRVWAMIRAKYPQSEASGWGPRLTLGIDIRSWTEWGILTPNEYKKD